MPQRTRRTSSEPNPPILRNSPLTRFGGFFIYWPHLKTKHIAGLQIVAASADLPSRGRIPNIDRRPACNVFNVVAISTLRPLRYKFTLRPPSTAMICPVI